MSDIRDTLNSRAKTHGDFRRRSATSQLLKDVMTACPQHHNLASFQKEALDMLAVKLSRILHGDANEPDHWHDSAGYMQLVAEELTDGKSNPTPDRTDSAWSASLEYAAAWAAERQENAAPPSPRRASRRAQG